MASDTPDPLDRPELTRIATAILNGDPIDWSAVESTTPAQIRSLVAQLRTLSAVTDFYRKLTPDAVAATVTPAGTMWGHLRIDERIGAGAFGQVFRAWDTRLDREVALKLLQPQAWPDADTTSGIVAEGRLLAKVRHPNVVTVYGAERIGAQIGLWMELVRGRTLADEVRAHGPLTPADVLSIARDLCRALHAVHAAGLIHCDVKAQNVVRQDDGRIVLMDFGAGAEAWPGMMAPVAGTPLYAAPEVLRGESVSVRSDIYSVGVLLYFLLTGHFPVRGSSLEEIRAAHGAPPPALPASTPNALARIVRQALSPAPAYRFESADAMAEAVERAAAARARRLWAAAIIVGAAALTGGAFLGSSLLNRQRTSPAALAAATLTGVQRVPAPAHLLIGRPAFDGGRLSYAQIDGGVASFDLATFEPRTDVHVRDGEMAEFTLLSPDGAQVAYQVLLPDGRYELRVASIPGGTPRVLMAAGRSAYPIPLQWSFDTTQLLMLLWRADGSRDLALVAAADGAERLLRTFTDAVPFHASLSGDGNWVVFDSPDQGSVRSRDVFILDTRSGATEALVTHAANDLFPTWTPDGAGVFFVSDRTGTMDGWIQRVEGGKALDEPRVVARNLGRVSALGFTRDGTFYYLARPGLIDVTTAEWDGSALRVGASRKLPSAFEGASAQPAWSPDGRYLAYIGLRGPVAQDRGGNVLVIRDTQTGTEREFAHDLQFALPAPQWRPDGTEVLIRGTDARNRTSYYRVDVTTGALTPTVMDPPGAIVKWSHSGDELLFSSGRDGLVAYDLANGAKRTVLSRSASGVAFIARFAEAPTGGAIAYSGVIPQPTGPPVASLRLLTSGGVQELLRANPGELVTFQAWTPDARHLLLTRFRQGSTDPHALWAISRDGRSLVDTGFTIDGWTQANGVVIHPAGTHIAFTVGEASWQLWRLANFLAAPASGLRY